MNLDVINSFYVNFFWAHGLPDIVCDNSFETVHIVMSCTSYKRSSSLKLSLS